MPTSKQIKSARRLMTHSEIYSVRLVAAKVECSPFAGGLNSERKGGQGEIHVAVPPPNARGEILPGNRLRVLVKYLVLGKTGLGEASTVLVRIMSTFELIYSLPEVIKPTPEEVNAFCKTNAMLNSWPYWREFVQNTIVRMNMPPLTLPLFRLTPVPVRTAAGRQSELQAPQDSTSKQEKKPPRK
jgi:preprotein translocase subunit SecB